MYLKRKYLERILALLAFLCIITPPSSLAHKDALELLRTIKPFRLEK